MAVQIGGKRDSGFDDPLGMLTDCHRRVERYLNIQHHVAKIAEGRSLTSEEREAVIAALNYFRESGPRHNSDEEESLFPRMREGGCADVLVYVERLESEHHEAEPLHQEAAELFARWMEDGALHEADVHRVQVVTRELVDIYREHIRIEEEIVFPRAAHVLDREVLTAMGAEFKARRSL